MGNAGDESPYILLFIQLQVQLFCLVKKFNVNIRIVVFDALINAVEGGEIVGRHTLSQADFGLHNRGQAVIAATDRALLNISIFVFEDPGSRRAQLAVEVSTVLAEELYVTEIELGVIAFCT